MRLSTVLVMGIIISSISMSAENLIFNSGFELGQHGFHCIKYLRLDTNPDFQYEGPVQDDEEKVAGQSSLRLPNRFAETSNLILPEIKLQPDADYTLSVWMKSSSANYPVSIKVLSASPDEKWDSKNITVNVGLHWTRYSMAFHTAADRKNLYYVISFVSSYAEKSPPATLWFDNMQLNRGGLADWEPAAEVEVAAEPEKKYWVKEQDAECKIKVSAVNYSKQSSSVKLDLQIVPDYSGSGYTAVTGSPQLITAGEVVTLEPEGKIVREIIFKTDRYGAFFAHPVANKNSSPGSGYFAVIGQYTPEEMNLDRDFCVALHVGSANIVVPPRWGETLKPGFRASGGSADEFFSTLSAMGCRLIRDWGYPQAACHWRILEPEEGKFDFSIMDKQLELLSRHNIKLLPVLGASDTMNYADRSIDKGTVSGLPQWLLNKSRRIAAPNWLVARKKGLFIPPLDNWRMMIRAMTLRYKGKLTHYEIMNEPNLCMDAHFYLQFLQVAGEEIRAADPSARIVGICSTGDLGGNVNSFISQVLNGGGANNLDILSFHPYNAPALSSKTSADNQISGIRTMLEKAGRPNLPLWNTELFFLASPSPRNDFEKDIVMPSYAAQRFLIDLGEGLSQSIPLRYGEFFKSVTPHTATSTYGNNTLIPNSNFIVYNALSRMFEGARAVRKLRFPQYGIICYIYSRKGRYIAAIWNYANKEGCYVDLSGFQLADIYGNSVKSGELLVDSSPLYLQPGAMSDEEFIEALEALKVRLEYPIQSGSIVRKINTQLYVNLYNESDVIQKGNIGFSGNGFTASKTTAFTILPNSRIVTIIDLDRTTLNLSPQITIKVNDTIRNIAVSMQESPEISGHILMSNAEGIIDFDDNIISVDLLVKDKSNAGKTGKRQLWETDCVELFFDTNPFYLPQINGCAYTDNTFRVFITPRDPVPVHIWGKINPNECNIDINNTLDGYSIKLQIPVKTGDALGLEVKINDVSGKEKSETFLVKCKSPQENRCQFGIIKKQL
ncbi:MAG: carbohydrate binding domain-containing protein [Victivallales bacterium]|nr:carbohydrate binding domain-containing protein [Victivallales bacterium]